MTFQPDALYQRGGQYTFNIPAGVLSAGGTQITEPLIRNFYAAMELFVLATIPENGGIKDYYS